MPTPLRRENVIVIPRSAHYANPYYVEQQPMNPIPVYARPDRTGTPSTWVSTEPADDIPPVKPEPVLTGAAARRREEREDDAFTSVSRAWSTTSSTGSSSTLRRGFSNILGNARPLVSLFSAPREDVQVITQAARRNGLFTGLIHRPDPPPEVKQEELSPRRNGAAHRGVQRDHSWWIILGQSAEAVGHLLDMQERDEMERVGGRRPDGTPNVGAYPVDVSAIKHSWLDSAFAGAVGGFIVFYLLAVMIV
ncbi:hypothetical protein EW026_g5456 [Hermanssonia centrifuga]|uniref:Uncharacterized protein n=1 Tax=Hermanssonia centrifuga TaxID=98765 RepID=A0A4S4KE31_9APHY|nr:hypothetical protein EW026_g5456 [Hermanssonia centrifuga]